MQLYLISFFISLAGIAFMIGRKLLVLSRAESNIAGQDTLVIEVPDLENVKRATVKGVQRASYLALVHTLRMYVLALHFSKSRYAELVEKIKKIKNRNRLAKGLEEEVQANKFLKMMSDYKHKIKKIKREIKEEEGIE